MADERPQPPDDAPEKIDARLDELEQKMADDGLDDDELLELERIAMAREGPMGIGVMNPATATLNAGIEKLEGMAEAVKAEIEDPMGDPEFQERLDRMGAKAKEIRQKREQQQHEKTVKAKSDQSAARGLGIGVSLAYGILGVPLLGYGIGYFIDTQAGTTTVRSWGFLAGLIAAILFALVTLQRANTREP
jgi:F0F1-type ATP synthase assembly protein I